MRRDISGKRAVFEADYLVLKDGGTGYEYARFPVPDGEEFSVGFIHSVNQSPVIDFYDVRNHEIYVTRTVYYGFGAGVQTELNEGETLEFGSDGEMIVSGIDRKIDHLSYIVGTVSDHILTIGGREISLRELCGRNARVEFVIQTFPVISSDSDELHAGS